MRSATMDRMPKDQTAPPSTASSSPDPHPPARRVRLRDVAAAAGVSIATASEAINGRGRVAPETRERVQAAVVATGYRPNALARALRTGHSRLIGVAIRPFHDDPIRLATHPYFSSVISAGVAAALARGYGIVSLPIDTELRALRDLPLEGLLVADSEVDDPFLDLAYALGIPIITDMRPGDPRARYTVDVDATGAMEAVFDHVWAAGARRPAVLSDPETTGFVVRSLAAYAERCQRHGVEPLIDATGGFDIDDRRAAATRLLAAGADAIVGLDDDDGWRLLEACAAAGRRVPDDVRIVATSPDDRYATATPPLTTLDLHPRELAAMAVDLTLDLIEGRHDGPERHIVGPFTIVPRASTMG